MTFEFRTRHIGMERRETIRQVKESWHGAEVSEVNDEVFVVRNEAVLPPFMFFFQTPKGSGGRVELILVEADPPFANVVLAVDTETTNYLLRCAPKALNRQEKRLCKALEKYGRIPRGRIE